MLRGVEGVAFLRRGVGLWLLGDEPMAFPRWINSPNSVGAFQVWHLCDEGLAPCDWLREALLLWHCCICALASPVERSDFGISAWS
jgi:hypothetical protein